MHYHAAVNTSRATLQQLYQVSDLPPSGPMQDGYPFVPSATVGIGGFPRAKPAFSQPAFHNLRHPQQGCMQCCNDCDIEHKGPGPNIPLHWLNNGVGYVTNYFTDVEPLDLENGKLGKYRCQMRDANGQQCTHVVEDEWLDCSPCGVAGNAPEAMRVHLMSHIPSEIAQYEHSRIKRPRFATKLCSDGDCAAICCLPCLVTRNALAARGYEDSCSCGACLQITAPVATTDCSYCCSHCYPHLSCGYPRAAFETCSALRDLNAMTGRDDCADSCVLCMCLSLNIGRSYRELVQSGVDPGNPCCGDRPKLYGNIAVDISQRQPALPALRLPELPQPGQAMPQPQAYPPQQPYPNRYAPQDAYPHQQAYPQQQAYPPQQAYPQQQAYPPQQAYPQQQAYQQQQPPPPGYQQQPPPPSGYQQQPPPASGYQQQQPPPSGYQQQPPPPSAYQQQPPPPSGYQQQPLPHQVISAPPVVSM